MWGLLNTSALCRATKLVSLQFQYHTKDNPASLIELKMASTENHWVDTFALRVMRFNRLHADSVCTQFSLCCILRAWYTCMVKHWTWWRKSGDGGDCIPLLAWLLREREVHKQASFNLPAPGCTLLSITYVSCSSNWLQLICLLVWFLHGIWFLHQSERRVNVQHHAEVIHQIHHVICTLVSTLLSTHTELISCFTNLSLLFSAKLLYSFPPTTGVPWGQLLLMRCVWCTNLH